MDRVFTPIEHAALPKRMVCCVISPLHGFCRGETKRIVVVMASSQELSPTFFISGSALNDSRGRLCAEGPAPRQTHCANGNCAPCPVLYRKPKLAHGDDEVRQGLHATRCIRPTGQDARLADPCPTIDVFSLRFNSKRRFAGCGADVPKMMKWPTQSVVRQSRSAT